MDKVFVTLLKCAIIRNPLRCVGHCPEVMRVVYFSLSHFLFVSVSLSLSLPVSVCLSFSLSLPSSAVTLLISPRMSGSTAMPTTATA